MREIYDFIRWIVFVSLYFIGFVLATSGNPATGHTFYPCKTPASLVFPGLSQEFSNNGSACSRNCSMNTSEILSPTGSFITGIITGYLAGSLDGVLVMADSFSTGTNGSGAYSLQLDAGTYNLVFTKAGYDTLVIPGLVVLVGSTSILDTSLNETPYPPSCACASVNFEDTQYTVSWCLPSATAGMQNGMKVPTMPTNIDSVTSYSLFGISGFDPAQPVWTGVFTLISTNLL